MGQPAGHAQMNDESIMSVEFEQEVFTASPYCFYGSALEPAAERFWRGWSNHKGVQDLSPSDSAAREDRRKLAADGLDFRQLRQGKLLSSRYFVNIMRIVHT